MKLLSILLLLFAYPTYAGNPHHNHPTPEPVPINAPDDGSNHNALLLGVILAAGTCWYFKCWKPKPVKAEASITPEISQNEYMRIRRETKP
jgi:hypothetical protein